MRAKMDAFKMFKCSILLFLFVFKTINDVDCGCTLSLQKDFASPSPVFLRNNNFLTPDDNGAISFQRSETLVVACPGNKRAVVLSNVTSNYDVQEAVCIVNNTFRVGRWIGQFKDIRCNSNPYYTTVESGTCYDGAKIYGVGYKIRSRFYNLYEACFNSDLLSTVYVKHALSPTNKFMQQVKRPSFIEGELFGKVRMSKVYKVDNQRDRLDAILGNNMSAKYITKKQFLSRGHLAARADFTLQAETRATFHYVNAVPQWQRGNAGDWAALEDALRRRVHSLGRTITIYTGTHSVMTLTDDKHRPRAIYLYADDNNNLQVPVPLYFYKLAYDPMTKSATAFISINSSYYNTSAIDELTFCSDVCDDDPRFNWLRWRSNDGTHSFCCNYEEFTNLVDYLPALDVEELFY